MELTIGILEPTTISILFEALTIHIDGLTRYPILFGKSRDRFTAREATFDVLYLLWRERGLPTALIVGVTLSGKGYAFFLSLSYHLALKLCDRSEDIEVEGLAGIGIDAVKLHSLFVEDDFYPSSEQFLYDIQKVTERACQTVYAVDVQGVAITQIGQTFFELGAISIFARAFVLKDLIQFYAVELSVGVLVYGGNSDIAYLLTAHRIFSLCRCYVLGNTLDLFEKVSRNIKFSNCLTLYTEKRGASWKCNFEWHLIGKNE